jgi:hypothetical protein
MRIHAVLAWFLVAGCSPYAPTEFRGEAFFPGGPARCVQSCAAQNLEMSSFVYSGEFATSCVCHVRAATASVDADADSVAVYGALARRQQEIQEEQGRQQQEEDQQRRKKEQDDEDERRRQQQQQQQDP